MCKWHIYGRRKLQSFLTEIWRKISLGRQKRRRQDDNKTYLKFDGKEGIGLMWPRIEPSGELLQARL